MYAYAYVDLQFIVAACAQLLFSIIYAFPQCYFARNVLESCYVGSYCALKSPMRILTSWLGTAPIRHSDKHKSRL